MDIRNREEKRKQTRLSHERKPCNYATLYFDIATALIRAHQLSLYVDFGVALINRKSSN